jgi:hypothetical protein
MCELSVSMRVAAVAVSAVAAWFLLDAPVAAGEGGTAINYTVESSGKISLAIYEPQTGRMIRELLRGAPQEAGEHSVTWDGLDRYGKSVSPGDYEWKLVCSRGFTATHTLTLGINPPDDPNAYWLGNHSGGPNALAEDETGLYFGAWMAEGPLVLLKLSPDRKSRLWERKQTYDGEDPYALAVADGKLFALNRTGHLDCIDRDSGKFLARHNLIWDGVKASDLASNGKQLALTYKSKNAIRILSVGGEVIEAFDIPAPDGICFKDEKHLLVSSESRVLEVSPIDKTWTEKVNGLANPRAVAFDPRHSHTYVAEVSSGIDNEAGGFFSAKGEKNDQIKKFDGAYKQVAAFGAKGGRQQGYFVPEDFSAITDLLVLCDGALLVTEMNSPRRTSLVDPDSGKIRDQWFGGQEFFTYAVMNVEVPNEVWFSPHVNAIVQAEVNWADKSWRVKSTNVLPEGAVGPITKVYRSHDVNYLVLAQPQVLRQDPATGKLAFAFTTKRDAENNPYLWADANEDGLEQPAECTPLPADAVPGLTSGSIVNNKFDFVFGATGAMAYARLPAGKFVGKHGAIPTWDWRHLQKGPDFPAQLRPDAGGTSGAAVEDDRGNLFQVYYSFIYPGLERHGNAWPAIECGLSRMLKWSPQGELLIDASRHGVDPGERGELFKPVKMINRIRGCVVALDRGNQNPGVIYTDDGLYVGTVHDHRADDGLPDYVYDFRLSLDDNLVGEIYELPSGEVLYFRDGNGWTYVFKITGWDQIERRSGKFHLASQAAGAARTGSGLRGTYFKELDFKRPAFKRIDPLLRFGARNDFDNAERFPHWWRHEEIDAGLNPAAISVVWEGELEAPTTDDYQFSAYLTGKADVWINKQLVLEARSSSSEASKPIRLTAGKKVPLRIEYQSTERAKTQFSGYDGPLFHLNWESLTRDRWSIPPDCLYPK